MQNPFVMLGLVLQFCSIPTPTFNSEEIIYEWQELSYRLQGGKKDIEEGKNKVSVVPSLCSPFSSFIEK